MNLKKAKAYRALVRGAVKNGVINKTKTTYMLDTHMCRRVDLLCSRGVYKRLKREGVERVFSKA